MQIYTFINRSVFLIGLFLLLSQETAPTRDPLVKFEVVELWGSIELCTSICFSTTGGLECFDLFAMFFWKNITSKDIWEGIEPHCTHLSIICCILIVSFE